MHRDLFNYRLLKQNANFAKKMTHKFTNTIFFKVIVSQVGY